MVGGLKQDYCYLSWIYHVVTLKLASEVVKVDTVIENEISVDHSKPNLQHVATQQL